MGKQLADEFGLRFWEASAKTGYNISEMFTDMASTIIKTKPVATAGGTTSKRLDGNKQQPKEQKKKGGWC